MKFLETKIKTLNDDEILSEMRKAKNGTQFVIDCITHKKEKGDDEVEIVTAYIRRNKE